MRPETEDLALRMILARVAAGQPIAKEDKAWAIDKISAFLASSADSGLSDQAEDYLRLLEP